MEAQAVSAAEEFFSSRLRHLGVGNPVAEVVVPHRVDADRRLAFLGAAFDLAQGQAAEQALGDDQGCVTLRLHLERGISDVPADEVLKVEGQVVAADGPVVITEARAVTSSGVVAARSTAHFLAYGSSASLRPPRREVTPFDAREGTLEQEMGLRWLDDGPGQWVAGADLGNPNGVIHGGAQLTAMACAAVRVTARPELRLRWITLVFARPALLGEPMSVVSHPQIGRAVGTLRVDLNGPQDRLCTQAMVGLI